MTSLLRADGRPHGSTYRAVGPMGHGSHKVAAQRGPSSCYAGDLELDLTVSPADVATFCLVESAPLPPNLTPGIHNSARQARHPSSSAQRRSMAWEHTSTIIGGTIQGPAARLLPIAALAQTRPFLRLQPSATCPGNALLKAMLECDVSITPPIEYNPRPKYATSTAKQQSVA